MRTAEEIYQDCTLKSLGAYPNGTKHDIEIMAINEARKEVIEESTELLIARIKNTLIQSKHSLIKELK